MTNQITIRLDPDTKEKLDYCIEYYKKQRIPKQSKGSIIKLAIHCLWVDVKNITK